MEVGKQIAEHTISEEQLQQELNERMVKLMDRRPKKADHNYNGYYPPENQSLLPHLVPGFHVSSYRFRRVGNFSILMVQGKRDDDTEDHTRIWVRSSKRNKSDKPNITRAAEICLNRVAEDILLNKPLN